MPPVKIVGTMPEVNHVAELLAWLIADQNNANVKKIEVYEHEKVS